MDNKVYLVLPDGSINRALEDPPLAYQTPAIPHPPPEYTTPTDLHPPPEYTPPAVPYSPPEYSEAVGYWSSISQHGWGQNLPKQVLICKPATKPVVQQPASQATVDVSPASQLVVQSASVQPPNYLWLACLVYWLCNCLAGTLAMALSLASSDAAEANRMQEARNYGKAALGTSVFGVVLGLTMMIAIVVISLHRLSDDPRLPGE